MTTDTITKTKAATALVQYLNAKIEAILSKKGESNHYSFHLNQHWEGADKQAAA
jgi:hypothetical protein